jgi:acetyl-CoA carboxylase carboxyl transferase subunit alpha
LLKFGIIDGIVAEPVGGAHRDSSAAIQAAGEAVSKALARFAGLPAKNVRLLREEKFLAMGRKG